MARDKRYQSEQVVSLLRQIEVVVALCGVELTRRMVTHGVRFKPRKFHLAITGR